MRLFFALWPSQEEQTRFRDAAQSLEPSVSGRWTAPEKLHLTLLFLPSVDEERVGSIFSLVDRSLLPGLLLRLDRLLFQPAGKEGLLWLAPSADCPDLTRLVDSLRARLLAGAFSLEQRRPFPLTSLWPGARSCATERRADSAARFCSVASCHQSTGRCGRWLSSPRKLCPKGAVTPRSPPGLYRCPPRRTPLVFSRGSPYGRRDAGTI